MNEMFVEKEKSTKNSPGNQFGSEIRSTQAKNQISSMENGKQSFANRRWHKLANLIHFWIESVISQVMSLN